MVEQDDTENPIAYDIAGENHTEEKNRPQMNETTLELNACKQEEADSPNAEIEVLISNKGGVSSKKNVADYSNSELMTEELNKYLRDTPLSEDTTCGFWLLKGQFFQKFANQTSYVVLYGLVGCIFSMTYAYFNGTITTLEKRFKIPSQNTGIISVGNDISQMLVSGFLSYYAGKGHRPRWIGFGLLTIVIFCILTALPHYLYGPGEDALSYTLEFGAIPDANSTTEVILKEQSKSLCRLGGSGAECAVEEGNLAPQVVLFAAQFISGIGGSLYYTLGVAYMDDNTKKSKTPALLSLSYFLRMLGPAIGYALASFCLRLYIAPNLHPIINDKDPRWLGAWWLGWLILGGILFISGIFLTMFPRELPRAAARRMIEEKRRNLVLLRQMNSKEFITETSNDGLESLETKASFKDMMQTFKRLIANKTMMCNNFSAVFYLFGYTPYWIFTPKYIEIQYRQSPATSSMVTGTIALAFSALGVLLSGLVISKYKPKARYMAAWNVMVGIITVAGVLAYAFIGCQGNEKSVIVNIPDKTSTISTCNSACSCDYVRYSPVCGENKMTYISPCHAGCTKQHISRNGFKTFYSCTCIPGLNLTTDKFPSFRRLTATDLLKNDSLDGTTNTWGQDTQQALESGQAITGACPVDCWTQFVIFLAVMCCLKFVGSTGRASNFLVFVRCVPEKDKTAAMGFAMMMTSMLAFIPSPIFFGRVIDRLCLVWGKTCTNKGNCWLYDPESLRYTLNTTAAIFIAIGALFDMGVWYYVKDLKIFDEEINEDEISDKAAATEKHDESYT